MCVTADVEMAAGMWYHIKVFFNSNETGPALALVATSTALSQVIGAPIGAALMLMDGLRGIRGWRWLFLIEGLITILFGIAFYVSISTPKCHFPHASSWDKNLVQADCVSRPCCGMYSRNAISNGRCQSYIGGDMP